MFHAPTNKKDEWWPLKINLIKRLGRIIDEQVFVALRLCRMMDIIIDRYQEKVNGSVAQKMATFSSTNPQFPNESQVPKVDTLGPIKSFFEYAHIDLALNFSSPVLSKDHCKD